MNKICKKRRIKKDIFSIFISSTPWQDQNWNEDECDIAGYFYRLPTWVHSHEAMTWLFVLAQQISTQEYSSSSERLELITNATIQKNKM